MDSLVSIVVPVYNVESFLEKCFYSINNQIYKNIEIILVDDGSTDGSGELCDVLAKNDSRAKVIHKQNGGLSDARNVGIDNANGKYIMFVDSDDWIERDTISDAIDAIERNNAEIAIFGICIDYDNSMSKKRVPLVEGVFDGKTALIYLNSFKNFNESACNKLFLMTLFKDVQFPKGKKCEDCYTIYKVLDSARAVVTVPSIKYHYFQRINSISRSETVNMDYLYAAKQQCNYIEEKYPDIEYVGKTCVAFAYLIMSGQKRSRIGKNAGKSEVVESRKYTLAVIRNKYLSISRKIQFILFAYFTGIYEKIKRKRI